MDAQLSKLPDSGRVRLVVGGSDRQILRVAAARADVVALSGLGRTLADGHQHDVRCAQQDVDGQLALIRAECDRSGTAPEIEALVHEVAVTGDRAGTLRQFSEEHGVSVAELQDTPFVLVGTLEQMATQLVDQAERLGIAASPSEPCSGWASRSCARPPQTMRRPPRRRTQR